MKTFLATLFFLALLTLSLCSYGNAFGTHGMVLLQTQQGLVASHLPLHHSMHAHQLLLKVEADNQQISQLLAQYPLVTLVPEKFDLHHLMHGELTQFDADVVAGHFERGGNTKLAEVRFTVSKILLNQEIGDHDNGYYYSVPLGKQTLLVHRIGALPSFDQILLSDHVLDNKTVIPLGNGKPLQGYPSLKDTPLHSLYLETQDFQAH